MIQRRVHDFTLSHYYNVIALFCLLINSQSPAQSIKRHALFESDSALQLTIETDFKSMYAVNSDSVYQKAMITFHLREKSIKEEVRIRVRGAQRRVVCSTPSLLIDFGSAAGGPLRKLNKLKLVTGCSHYWKDEQLVIKEYLVYKLYNLLTEKSFKVRLARINYQDIKKPSHAYLQYAFFIEDTDDMAARNNCRELNRPVKTEETNRKQMTLLAIFQYMIGNVDWAVPVLKNIKLIVSRTHTDEAPFAVPYDFDYAGIVNAEYAVPNPEYNIETVKERVYQGFPRKPEEISDAIDSLLLHKGTIDAVIRNCKLLQNVYKKEMLAYLDEFYLLIADKKKANQIFIDNARRY
ncbi:MAG: hypothetical protein IPP72_20520 [Chitinophagaceae bacterium]|nr:hypothetical protein [Chitinophagaceae bacterium]